MLAHSAAPCSLTPDTGVEMVRRVAAPDLAASMARRHPWAVVIITGGNRAVNADQRQGKEVRGGGGDGGGQRAAWNFLLGSKTA